jgi:hypothetical protein
MVPRFLRLCLGLALPSAAFACDLCAVYSAVRAQGPAPSAWTAAVATQFVHFSTLRLDGTEVPNEDGQRIDSTITQLVLARGFGERWAVQVSLPFINRSYQRPAADGREHGRVRGLGDAVLLARSELLQLDRPNTTVRWDLLAGVKLPTGSSRRLAEELDEARGDRPPLADGASLPAEGPASGVHGHDLALGSGSVDAIVGSNLYVRWRRGLATGLVQAANRRRGDHHYRYANDLTWEVAPGYYVVLGHPHTLALHLVIAGERKTLDDLAGEPAGDTGLSSVYVGPRLTYTHGERLAASLGAEFPRRMRTTALQLTADYRVRASFSWSF